jgi:hypothetical protein
MVLYLFSVHRKNQGLRKNRSCGARLGSPALYAASSYWLPTSPPSSFTMRTGIWAGAVLLLASVIPGALAQDPCDKLAGKTHARPDDALACYKSWPFNETIRQNVLSTVARVFDFFTFEEYHLDPPAPFHEVKVNIKAEIDRINKTVYAVRSPFRFSDGYG